MDAVGSDEEGEEEGLQSGEGDVGRDEEGRGGTGGEDAGPEVFHEGAHDEKKNTGCFLFLVRIVPMLTGQGWLVVGGVNLGMTLWMSEAEIEIRDNGN